MNPIALDILSLALFLAAIFFAKRCSAARRMLNAAGWSVLLLYVILAVLGPR